MSDDEVITPAGRTRAGHVHEVRPGQGVEQGPGGPAVRDEMVLTPGGWKHPSLVHHVEPGMSVEHHENRLRIVDPDGAQVRDCGRAQYHPDRRPLHPRASRDALRNVSARGAVPALGEGWITYASWTNDTGAPVSRFATTWTVPPAPRTDNGQTVFLFNGIQNSTMIYQPVLQWGPSAAGGGSRWSVASWYADGQTGQSF
ncbi:MAG: hypothetical protein WCG47_13210 [Dermatophilaceae bacterium]